MKKYKAINDRAYIFKITLDLGNPMLTVGRVNRKILEANEPIWREIAMLGRHSLYQFAEAIVDSFGFMFDHYFGFFDNLQNWIKSEEIYELFKDIGEECEPWAKGVKKTKIKDAFSEKGKTMLFYFDYGDDWKFIVTITEIILAQEGKSYPILLSQSGTNPEQYPPCEDE